MFSKLKSWTYMHLLSFRQPRNVKMTYTPHIDVNVCINPGAINSADCGPSHTLYVCWEYLYLMLIISTKLFCKLSKVQEYFFQQTSSLWTYLLRSCLQRPTVACFCSTLKILHRDDNNSNIHSSKIMIFQTPHFLCFASLAHSKKHSHVSPPDAGRHKVWWADR